MPSEISRRRFLESMAVAAAGASVLAGCGSGDAGGSDAPAAAPATAPPGGAVVTGGGQLKAGQSMPFTAGEQPGLLFMTTDGKLNALSSKCTHKGCDLKWQETGNVLHCPCHDSDFDANGTPLKGPAKQALPRFKVEVQGNDVVITKA